MQGIEHKTCADTKIPSNKRRINIIYKYHIYLCFWANSWNAFKTKTNKSPGSCSCFQNVPTKYKTIILLIGKIPQKLKTAVNAVSLFSGILICCKGVFLVIRWYFSSNFHNDSKHIKLIIFPSLFCYCYIYHISPH